MSYSRWSSSFWYTFWTETDFGISGKSKEEEYFQICDMGHGMSFSYKELKEDIDDCLERVVENFSKDKEGKLLAKALRQKSGRLKTIYEATTFPGVDVRKHIPELKIYMEQFLEDVDEEYSK